MVLAVADTHAALWYLFDAARLSRTARSFLDAALPAGDQVGLSSITLAETVYLIEKGRIPPESFDRLVEAVVRRITFVEIPVDRAITHAMFQVRRRDVPDMPDRIIAATALHLGVPLISRDRKIRLSSVRTIW